jgi:hypothetical protein
MRAPARHIHDLPAAPGLHHLDHFPAPLDHRRQVDVQDRLDLRVLQVFDVRDPDPGAVVVHQHVHATEPVQRRLDQGVPVGRLHRIRPDRQQIGRRQFLGRPVEPLLVAPGDHHARVHLQQDPRGLHAESGGTAGNDHDLILHIVFHRFDLPNAIR